MRAVGLAWWIALGFRQDHNPDSLKDDVPVGSRFTLYSIGKGALSKFISGGCRRRLRLDLYAGTSARRAAGAVDKDERRPGAQHLIAQGREHESRCFRELIAAFGDHVIRGVGQVDDPEIDQSFTTLKLAEQIANLTPGTFVLEAQYEVPDSFAQRFGIDSLAGQSTRLATCRPDILVAVGAQEAALAEPDFPRRLITPAGDVIDVAEDDERHGLLVVDIKLSSEPSPSHFAELAYYGMTLAAWLEESGFSDRYFVMADACIWPGNHSGSMLARYLEGLKGSREVKTVDGLRRAWAQDLERMPAEVMLGRLQRVLRTEIHEVVAPADWRDLPVHIDAGCAGCGYLGFDFFPDEAERKDPDYCWPTSERDDNLSRIPGMTKGAAGKLEEAGFSTVAAVAGIDLEHQVFDGHQVLNAGRTIIQARAKALSDGEAIGLPVGAGSSSSLPRFSDVRVALSVDFESSSGRAFALGYEIVAAIPSGKKMNPEWKGGYERKAARDGGVVLIRSAAPADEARAFGDFLEELRSKILDLQVTIAAAYKSLGDEREPTIQFYVWDEAVFAQLRAMMGRHLAAQRYDDGSRSVPMAWMFPPEEMLQDAGRIGPGAPVTIVRNSVRLLALDLPHFYSQMAIANRYRHLRPGANREPYDYRVSFTFSDPLSDRIPPERGHELWAGVSPRRDEPPEEFEERFRKAVQMRLWATLSIARKLAHDLNDSLVSHAPTIKSVFSAGRPLYKVANDLQLVYQHARLMEAAARSDVAQLMAMAPAEREARFASIRLTAQLHGGARQAALTSAGLSGDRTVLVFRMSERSRDAKIKAGEVNLSVMPEAKLHLADDSLAQLRKHHPELDAKLPIEEDEAAWEHRVSVRESCSVEVLAIDRGRLEVIVRAEPLVLALAEIGVFDLQFDADAMGIIDPVHRDAFVRRRLKPALEAIGTPPLSISARFMKTSLSRVPLRREAASGSVPLEGFVWDAERLWATPTRRNLEAAWAGVLAVGRPPLPRQELAIRAGIGRRLSLMWGPPGTGKSATSIRLLTGLAAEAAARGESVRIVVTGPTWVAIDNVLQELPEALTRAGLAGSVSIARLMSERNSADELSPALRNYATRTQSDDPRMPFLLEDLTERRRSVIVGATASQLARLRRLAGEGLQQLFDHMLIDEASQMDVASAIVAFTVLADDASLTVVGDDKQMQPIHPVEPPVGAEHLVGSIYDFYAQYRRHQGGPGIRPTMLDTNFRSNAEIVGFFKGAGYDGLSAFNPNLSMELSEDLPIDKPAAWPPALEWSPLYRSIMMPDRPLVAVIHEDAFSSQRNPGEAHLVAALAATIMGRLKSLERPGETLSDADFFVEGLGVVTPHRAQQAAIIEALDQSFDLPEEARQAMVASVDTVERFQGQQRIAMIASFGMGDVDQIGGEEEFLFSLNRFNVIASRARAKLIVVLSRSMANHLPRSVDALRQSSLLKSYVGGTALPSAVARQLPRLGRCEIRFRER